MLPVQTKRYILIALVWLTGIVLALGSKSYDPDVDEILPPVIVDFEVIATSNFELRDGTTIDTLDSAELSGSFSKAANARISLRDIPVTLDTNTAIAAAISPLDTANLLAGVVAMGITEDLSFGFNRVPEQGQISTDINGTTTLVTFDGNSGNVILQTGNATAQTLTFSNFRNDHSNESLGIDHRMASKAYRIAENVWQLARISETLQREVDEQRSLLEAMNLNVDLDLNLNCNNTNNSNIPVYVMRWTFDANDTGNAGNGDRFTADWRNCELLSDTRFLEGNLELLDYQFANSVAPRSLSYMANLSRLYYATEELPAAPAASGTSEFADGILSISVTEQSPVP